MSVKYSLIAYFVLLFSMMVMISSCIEWVLF